MAELRLLSVPRHQEQADAAQLMAPPVSPQGQLQVHGEHEQGAHPNITHSREQAEQCFPAPPPIQTTTVPERKKKRIIIFQTTPRSPNKEKARGQE